MPMALALQSAADLQQEIMPMLRLPWRDQQPMATIQSPLAEQHQQKQTQRIHCYRPDSHCKCTIFYGHWRSSASIDQPIAIGRSATANGDSAATFGAITNASGDFSLALGYKANSAYTNSTAIGRSATTTKADQIALGINTTEVIVPNIAGTGNQVVYANANGTLVRLCQLKLYWGNLKLHSNWQQRHLPGE